MKLRQLARVMTGWGLILVGIAGLLLPILPGVVFLLPGLTLVSSRHSWARKLLETVDLTGAGFREQLALFFGSSSASLGRPWTEVLGRRHQAGPAAEAGPPGRQTLSGTTYE